jgi:zinc transport system substrate-binding protein
MTMNRRRIRMALAALAGLAVPLAGPALADPPRVVATIAPVHSLVAQVMQGVGEPVLLLPPEVSEHDYALRPSDARAIAGADLVVWLGEALETYLADAIEAGGRPHLELLAAPGVEPVAYRDGAAKTHDGHEGEAAHEDGAEDHDRAAAEEHAHAHLGLDPHVWLDPVRAQAIVAAFAARLAEIDPENAGAYRANAERARASLAALDADLRDRLAPHAAAPFIAFHDAYAYFNERYGLTQAGRFTLDPQSRPGARTLADLRDRIEDQGVACAFAEPQFDDRLVERLAEETGMAVGRLDPVGAGIAPGPALYDTLIRQNAEAIVRCLSHSS